MSYAIIPESAPFNEEQRAWLNGFLAGWAGVESTGNGTLLGDEETVLEEEFPWHDAALNSDERLTLAEGKPLNRRMMAAMAQLDCGACGYLCQSYSEAIASGEEKNLTLCSPGGKETAKLLKRLLKEEGGASAIKSQSRDDVPDSPTPKGYSRANPYMAKVLSCSNLNQPGSSKQTTHVEIDLGKSGLDYHVGDSLGVYPLNCPDLVEKVLTAIGSTEVELREALTTKYCLSSVNDELLELLANKATSAVEKDQINGLLDSEALDKMDVLDVLRLVPTAAVTAESLMETLTEIAPRLYSIASSHRAHPGEVHLTIAKATATAGERLYKGVASTMFADRIVAGDRVGVFVHASNGFTVPENPAAPMVMVGPGTGIAPFRAFLEERKTIGARGKNWLFFGDQHADSDFLYRPELEELATSGLLTKLSTAFSRDQTKKVYVQDRMREEGNHLFRWLEEGGHFYVCGDAKRMAVDVDRTLHEVIATHSGKGESFAKQYVEDLKAAKRYVRDVY